MKRRRFVAAIGSALAFPSALRAQAPRNVRRIGYLGWELNPNLPPEKYPSSQILYLSPARQRIAEVALQHRLPSVFAFQAIVEAGGLLSYGTAPEEARGLLERALEYVDRILRGARPAELPVHRPSRYALTINHKTAKAIGVTIPQSILIRADRLIQ